VEREGNLEGKGRDGGKWREGIEKKGMGEENTPK